MTKMKIGDEVSITFAGFFKHRGVCVENSPYSNEPIIAHNSKKHKGVIKSTLKEFSESKNVSIRTRNTALESEEIVEAAENRMGKPYSLFDNCEDFVSDVLGLNEGSPQRVFWGSVLVIGGLIYLGRSR